MQDARRIANRLLALANENHKTLTPMQLIKLVYMSHGWMLGIYGLPLISNTTEAWKFGPVIPDLYQVVKRFRDRPVDIDELSNWAHSDMTPQEDSIVRQVFEIYGDYSGPALSRITHQKGSPWEKTFDPNGWGDEISNDIIEDHYKALYAER